MGTTTSILQNEHDKKIKHIVFSGGSVKAIAHCGAITALSKRGVLTGVKSFAGTSAGSIIASLIAVGYTPEEMCDIMKKMDIEKLVETEYKVTEVYNLAEKMGAHTGTVFHDFLGDLIEKKTGNKDYTVQQLFEKTGITLIITTTDLNQQSVCYFYPNHKNEKYRNVPIRLAVRMSMSIPGFFCPVIFDGNYHVDGGLLNNYPIRVFDGENPDDKTAYVGELKPNSSVLGLNIITDHDLKMCEEGVREEITGWSTFLPLLLNVGMVDNIRKDLVKADLDRTIHLITPNISPTRFNISDKEKEELINIGVNAVNDYFC